MDHHYSLGIYASVMRTAVDRGLGSAVFFCGRGPSADLLIGSGRRQAPTTNVIECGQ